MDKISAEVRLVFRAFDFRNFEPDTVVVDIVIFVVTVIVVGVVVVVIVAVREKMYRFSGIMVVIS